MRDTISVNPELNMSRRVGRLGLAERWVYYMAAIDEYVESRRGQTTQTQSSQLLCDVPVLY